ncbi:cytochrome P450 307a1 [Stomoxys calcitrans]|uniref:Cytochrome P450 307a1-like n=1 Tax=Stomoxys calcitrans TaxID=35570 RepID=A0A1I8Q764_STOCA|nr:cytochrome P450 307a1 [Stomoxys calcitrans]
MCHLNLLSPTSVSLYWLYGYLAIVSGCVRQLIVEVEILVLTYIRNVLTAIQDMNFFDVYKYKTKRKCASGPSPWPILGNLIHIASYDSPYKGFSEMAKKFGGLYNLSLGMRRCVVVSSMQLISEVLNSNGKHVGGRPDFIRFNVLFGGNRSNSLALCDWSQLQQKRRNLARKYCSPRNGSHFLKSITDVGRFEVHELLFQMHRLVGENNEPIILKPLIQRACANMFSSYMCSTRFDYNDIEFQNIVHCFDEIFWEINQGYIIDFLPWLGPLYYNHLKKIIKWSEEIRTFILKRIILKKENNIKSSVTDNDFAEAILKSLSADEGITRENVIYMLEDFIGGHSAIGNLIMLTLAYIVKNPEIGKNIQTEIDNTLDNCPRLITQKDASAMPYTMSTIYEVLRFSSSPIVPHVTTADIEIGGYDVPKGTIVFLNNYDLNTNPIYWNNPEEFDPKRFIVSEGTKSNLNASNNETERIRTSIPHFLPFSVGKRTCIGQSLVKGFCFIIIANIMNTFNVSSNDVSQIKTYPACIALPVDTFSLTVTPRNPTVM